MTVTEEDLNQLRTEVSEKLAAVNLDLMGALTALSDHVSRFNSLETRFDVLERRVDKGFDKVDDRFDKMDDRFEKAFDKVDRKFERIEDDIKYLSEKVDRRYSWQTFVTVAVGTIILFAEPLRELIGL